jgi:ABC-type nitrate/sulfonate/bicarbonate transport system permease component
VRSLTRSITGAAGLLGWLGVWELSSVTGVLDQTGVPDPLTIARRLTRLAGDPDFRAALLATVLAWGLALGLTVLLAIPAGLVLGSIPLARTATDVLVEVIRPVPSVALIPLCLVTLGGGPVTKIVLAVFAGTWPLLFAVLTGLTSVDPQWLDTARTLGSTRLRLLWRIRLPVVWSFAVTGLRLSASLELIVLVSTEYLAGQGTPGLGSYLNLSAEQTGDLTTLLTGAVVVGALGIVMGALLLGLQRPWHARVTVAGTTPAPVPRWQRLLRFAQRWTALALWIGLWELVTARTRSVFAPTPLSIATAAVHLAHTPGAIEAITVSLARLGLGWVIAVLLGVAAGLLLGSWPVVADLAEAPAAWCRSIPTVLMLPVLVVWVPIGTPLSVAIIALGAVWPILLHTLDGVRAVEVTLLDTARAYGVTWWRRLGWVLLPAAGPRILAGLRISLSLALILLLVSELAGASDGIGFQLLATQSLFAFPQMWAWLTLTGALGYLLNRLVHRAGRLALPWHTDPLT